MSKSKITTLVLLFMTVVLIAAILLVGYVITRPPESTSMIAPKQTKAQSITYSRLITFNQVLPTATPIETPTEAPTTVPTAIPTETPTPSPTEILLAKAISPTTAISTLEATVSPTIIPTKTTSLPETGTITNGLFIFAAAGLMIFFSFLF